MIKSITVNHTVKDFWGHDEILSDVLEWCINEARIAKAIKAVASGKAHAAHFHFEDGSYDTIYTEYGDVEAKQLTYIHHVSEWSKDAPVKMTVREFKRKIKKELEK